MEGRTLGDELATPLTMSYKNYNIVEDKRLI